MPCSIAFMMLTIDAAVRCPYSSCGPISSGGQWWFFGASADGSSGYVPQGFQGFSAGDIASLRLEPIYDCSKPGHRIIDYSLHGRAGLDTSGFFVTEHQKPPSWAAPGNNGMTTDKGGFLDDIWGTDIGPSTQTFTLSRSDPRKNNNAPSVPGIVRLPMPGGLTDYGTLAIHHGGSRGYMYIQGNKSGFVPEQANGDCQLPGDLQ